MDDSDYSTQKISPQLIAQIIDALKNKAWGSVEIYVENYNVVQITQRTITKLRKNGMTTPVARPNSQINHRFHLKIQKLD